MYPCWIVSTMSKGSLSGLPYTWQVFNDYLLNWWSVFISVLKPAAVEVGIEQIKSILRCFWRGKAALLGGWWGWRCPEHPQPQSVTILGYLSFGFNYFFHSGNDAMILSIQKYLLNQRACLLRTLNFNSGKLKKQFWMGRFFFNLLSKFLHYTLVFLFPSSHEKHIGIFMVDFFSLTLNDRNNK